MTWSSLTTSRRHHRPRFWVEVQGIERIFTEELIRTRSVSGASWSSVTSKRSQVVCLEDIKVGQSSIDLDTRRQIGGDLTVRLRDSGNVLRALFAPRTRPITWISANETASDTTLSVASTSSLQTLSSGSSASITAASSGTVTVSGLTSLTSSYVGYYLTLGGTGTTENGGTWLITEVVSSTTAKIFNVDGVAGDANNGSITWSVRAHVFIGAETVYLTGKTSTTLTGCSRAQYGSRAQAHFGDANSGSSVYLVPPAWLGRRVSLKSVYRRDDGYHGTYSTASTDVATLGTYSLEEAPQYLGDDTWELRCSELSDRYAEARCYVGLHEMPCSTGQYIDTPTGVVETATDQGSMFRVGTMSTHVRFRMSVNDAWSIRRLTAVDGGYASITVALGSDLAVPDFTRVAMDRDFDRNNDLIANGVASMQHIAVLTGDPSRITLALLCSNEGTGATTNDKLPGRVRSGFGGAEWRFGAGLDESNDIDVAAFTDARDEADYSWTLIVDEEMTVGELLREFCMATGRFWYVTSAGKLSVARLEEGFPRSSSAQSVTLADGTTGQSSDDAVSLDERSIYHTVTIKANHDTLQDSYLATVSVVDHDLRARYPESSSSIEIKSRCLSIDTAGRRASTSQQTVVRSNPISTTQAEIFARSYQARFSRGRLLMRGRFAWDAAEIVPGQSVQFSSTRSPDYAGSTLSSSVALVVGKALDLETGEVDLELLLQQDGVLIAPAATITGVSGAVLTLSTTAAEVTGSSPGTGFAVGWTVLVWDVSAATSYSRTISAVTATTITLSSSVAGLTTGEDFVTLTSQGSVGSQTSGDGYLATYFAYMQPDNRDPNNTDLTRWM